MPKIYSGSFEITIENINIPNEIVLEDFINMNDYEYSVHITPIIDNNNNHNNHIPNVAASEIINDRFNIFSNEPCKVNYFIECKKIKKYINVDFFNKTFTFLER